MTENVAIRAGRREWAGLAVLILPTLLLSIDVTVLHLAVPMLSADLRPSASQLLWINDVYGFLIAGFLITMGAIGDRIGRKRLLLIGATAFAVASALAAYAPSAGLLIVARGLLGIAGATLMPSTLSLIRTMFRDPAQRTVAISLWMTGFTGGMVIGPLVGGAMLESFWWGSVFLLGVPVMAVLLVAGPWLLPEYRDPAPGRLDLVSVALSLAAVISAIYGIKEIAAYGLGAGPAAAVVAGVVLGAVFVRRQRRLADPLLDLALFAERRFSASLGVLMLVILVGPGIMLLTAQYLQLVAGLTPLQAGLWSLPQAASLVLGFTAAPALARRVRPGSVMAGGLVVSAAGMGLMAAANGTSGLAFVVTAQVLFFFGAAPLMVLGTDMVVGSAPPERAGAASALSETVQEFGGALGLAVFGSIAAAVYRARMAVPEGVPAGIGEEARDTLGAAAAAAARLSDPAATALLDSARAAFTASLQVTAVVGAILVALTAALTAVVMRPLPVAAPAAPQEEKVDQAV
ncbi:DHA2 family multidrug resistance protein-like MFS transporter [Nonomuraea polychroma]|uniref:DHA2 family multidrug resistance protein-like MFS transporter n=1 Tax=Nonomuraea polychroma TaxID=46176 RepID=A0A438M7V1_9ACTN|nr:MFS transporter [Nonomuraea polychroma]RVX41804.1 DHA2 family multidrug resistance protein-like MFS transporter [Nonomuraea polychroma]